MEGAVATGPPGPNLSVNLTDAELPDYRLGFNQFTIETTLIVFLVPLHIAMVVFIVLHGRADKSFRQAFFIAFAAVALVDCFRTVMLHMTYLDVLCYPLVALNTYCLLIAQSLFHLLISINRFTVFYFPLNHRHMWSLTYYAVPMLSGSLVEHADEIDTVVSSATCVSCAIASFVLSVASFFKLRAMSKAAELAQKSPRQEAMLLLHSTFMVVMQLLVAFHASTFLARAVWAHAHDHSFAATLVHATKNLSNYLPEKEVNELYSLSGTVFLLLISGHTRKAFFRFYFKCGRGKPTPDGSKVFVRADDEQPRNRRRLSSNPRRLPELRNVPV